MGLEELEEAEETVEEEEEEEEEEERCGADDKRAEIGDGEGEGEDAMGGGARVRESVATVTSSLPFSDLPLRRLSQDGISGGKGVEGSQIASECVVRGAGWVDSMGVLCCCCRCCRCCSWQQVVSALVGHGDRMQRIRFLPHGRLTESEGAADTN